MDDGSLCALHANGPVHAMECADGAVGIRAAGFRTQCAIRESTLRLAGLAGLLAALLALASIGILASLPRLLAGRLIAVLGVFLGLLLLRLLLLVGLILIGHYKSSSTCIVDLFSFNFGLSQPTGRTKAIHVI